MALLATNSVHWTGPSNLTYTVEGGTSLRRWTPLSESCSKTTNYWFTNSLALATQFFYRVVLP
jgi:hypothetical protein